MATKLRKLVIEIGALPMILGTVIIVLSTLLGLFLFGLVESNALIGFLGVVIGSGLTASTSLLTARENRRGQLAIAALDKRLEAHQKAYRIWRRIIGSAYKRDERDKVLEDANKFWESNCLYLDPESREAFIACVFRAYTHQDILQGDGPRDKETMESAKESWKIIKKPGELLVKGVALPSLGEKEFEVNYENAPNQANAADTQNRRG